MLRMIQQTPIREIMDVNPLTFTASFGLQRALGLLLDHQVVGAPVVDDVDQLVGFVSEQDILRELWANDFVFNIDHCIGDVMRGEIITVSPWTTLDELACDMVVDTSKLFENKNNNVERIPGNFHDDLLAAQACRPKIYPVVENGILLGTIDRRTLLSQLHRLANTEQTKTLSSTL